MVILCSQFRLQEYFFSRRRLVFIHGQVFFYCPKHLLQEDAAFSGDLHLFSPALYAESWRTKEKGIASEFQEDSAGYSYSDLVYEYTRRELGWENDILKAFAGMASYVESRLETFILFGLPAARFDIYLLWYPHMPTQRRPSFPSWTWAGWYGSVNVAAETYPANGEDMMWWQDKCTWIRWHVVEHNQCGIYEVNGDRCCSRLSNLSATNIKDKTTPKAAGMLIFESITLVTELKTSTERGDRYKWTGTEYKASAVRGDNTLDILNIQGDKVGYVFPDSKNDSSFSGPATIILLSAAVYGAPVFFFDETEEMHATGVMGMDRFEIVQKMIEEIGLDTSYNILWVSDSTTKKGKIVAERRGVGQVEARILALPDQIKMQWQEIVLI